MGIVERTLLPSDRRVHQRLTALNQVEGQGRLPAALRARIMENLAKNNKCIAAIRAPPEVDAQCANMEGREKALCRVRVQGWMTNGEPDRAKIRAALEQRIQNSSLSRQLKIKLRTTRDQCITENAIDGGIL